jgi:D-Tyr-tRNAtyr deacylase
MKTVIQRVCQASVKVNNVVVAQIAKGLLVFVGIEDADGISVLRFLNCW